MARAARKAKQARGSSRKWIQGAINPKNVGACTPMTKKTCTPHRKALAKRFKPGGDLYRGKKSK